MGVRREHRDRLMRQFGRRLRAARLTTGYEEAADFAKDLGIEPARYRRYERGEAMPPLDILQGIARATGRNLHWLLTGSQEDRTGS